MPDLLDPAVDDLGDVDPAELDPATGRRPAVELSFVGRPEGPEVDAEVAVGQCPVQRHLLIGERLVECGDDIAQPVIARSLAGHRVVIDDVGPVHLVEQRHVALREQLLDVAPHDLTHCSWIGLHVGEL